MEIMANKIRAVQCRVRGYRADSARESPGDRVLIRYVRFARAAAVAAVLAAALLPGPAAGGGPVQLRAPDVRYEPTEPAVVEAMLQLAEVRPGERVYDLGCGDGRVVIAAVVQRGARGVCVDIDPRRIAESRENARRAGVEDRIEFVNGDLYEVPIADADVVMLFLYPDVNLKLRPRLLRELKPGARVVSHWHDMGDWEPLRKRYLRAAGRGRNIYLWTIPAR